MPSFRQLWEHMRRLKEEQSEEQPGDTPAMMAIRTGLNQDPNFWSMFQAVLGNSEHIADLLGVPPEKISSWHSRISENLDKVQQTDEQPDAGSEQDTKTDMLPTGMGTPENGPANTPSY